MRSVVSNAPYRLWTYLIVHTVDLAMIYLRKHIINIYPKNKHYKKKLTLNWKNTDVTAAINTLSVPTVDREIFFWVSLMFKTKGIRFELIDWLYFYNLEEKLSKKKKIFVLRIEIKKTQLNLPTSPKSLIWKEKKITKFWSGKRVI